MSKQWPIAKLGKVTTPVERPEVPVPGKAYRQLGVKLWGEGAYERETLDGGATKYATLSRVESDDIVVNKIWARNGSVAVVPPPLSGCFVSGEFPTFRVRLEILLPRWMHWLTKSSDFWFQCDEKSQGTSGKNRIKPEEFLRVEIPLPPLTEQQRIVARIEQLAAQVHQARALRHQAAEQVKALWPMLLRDVLVGKGTVSTQEECETAGSQLQTAAKLHHKASFPKHNNAHPYRPVINVDGPFVLPKGWVWTTLGSLLTHMTDCVNDTPNFAGHDTGYIGLKSTNIRPYRLDLTQRWFMTSDDFRSWNRRETPQGGDIVLTREAPMGYACMIPAGLRACLTQRLMLMRPNKDAVLPEWLLHYLNSPWFSEQVWETCRGLTTPHIRVKDAPNFIFALPPLSEQRRIVAELDALQVKVDAMKRLETETASELDALLPAILDRAFKGEL